VLVGQAEMKPALILSVYSKALLFVALLVALAGYFGPWVWHPSVALRYSADDLAEFVKLMPGVRSGQVSITRELFYLPIWLASIGLALWLGRIARSRWMRWLAGLPVVYASMWPMPMYPFILDAYRSPEFSLSFWVSVLAATLCVIALAFGSRLPDRATASTWIAIGSTGASVAPLHFVRLQPALDVLHGWTMSIGWGIVAVVIGFLTVAVAGAWQWRQAGVRHSVAREG
jgi:hypothetical protein